MSAAKSPYPQIRKMRCPYCGWVRTVPLSVLDEDTAAVARGHKEETRGVAERIRGKLAERRLEVAGAWIDVPGCPHCQRIYQYNVHSENTRP